MVVVYGIVHRRLVAGKVSGSYRCDVLHPAIMMDFKFKLGLELKTLPNIVTSM